MIANGLCVLMVLRYLCNIYFSKRLWYLTKYHERPGMRRINGFLSWSEKNRCSFIAISNQNLVVQQHDYKNDVV